MTTVYRYNGKLIIQDNKIGIDQRCCCSNECSIDDQCCQCYSSYGKLDPADACVAPFIQDPTQPERCEFFGSSVICPCLFPNAGPCDNLNTWQPRIGWSEAEATIWCGQQHPDANAISVVGPVKIGWCCDGECKPFPCDQV